MIYETGTRNRSGARVRSFTGTDKLEARLACHKPTTQFNRSFSGGLVPVAYDEDVDIELEHKIIMRNGYAHAREVRQFVDAPQVFADQTKQAANVLNANPVLDDKSILAIRKGANLYNGSNRSAKSLKHLRANIAALKPRFKKSLWVKYTHGKINEIQLLAASGLVKA